MNRYKDNLKFNPKFLHFRQKQYFIFFIITLMSPRRLSLHDYTDGVVSGNRFLLSQAITLIESRHPDDQALANKLLQALLPSAGSSFRIGITGVPGVGKSTFIEALGILLNQQGRSLAVLTVDPSSEKSKGSILGDKTRMSTLARSSMAYVRPSAAGGALGGVAYKTREIILLCEAAGYDVVVVETVGVGQSETEVCQITDFFLLLVLAGAGDELQGIKKGVMELADALVINKADGDNRMAARRAQQEYQNALQLFRPSDSQVPVRVLTCSARHYEGIAAVWDTLQEYQRLTQANGHLQQKREEQNLQWMHRLLQNYLQDRFWHHPPLEAIRVEVEQQVKAGALTAQQGAQTLIAHYEQGRKS